LFSVCIAAVANLLVWRRWFADSNNNKHLFIGHNFRGAEAVTVSGMKKPQQLSQQFS